MGIFDGSIHKHLSVVVAATDFSRGPSDFQLRQTCTPDAAGQPGILLFAAEK
jgi:hypothetical protein